jgi:hypothetical protein
VVYIRRLIYLLIVIIIAVISSGCGEEAQPIRNAVPFSGAASDLQARFAEAFEDYEADTTADGTIRFEPEPVTEPPPEITEIESTEPVIT